MNNTHKDKTAADEVRRLDALDRLIAVGWKPELPENERAALVGVALDDVIDDMIAASGVDVGRLRGMIIVGMFGKAAFDLAKAKADSGKFKADFIEAEADRFMPSLMALAAAVGLLKEVGLKKAFDGMVAREGISNGLIFGRGPRQ